MRVPALDMWVRKSEPLEMSSQKEGLGITRTPSRKRLKAQRAPTRTVVLVRTALGASSAVLVGRATCKIEGSGSFFGHYLKRPSTLRKSRAPKKCFFRSLVDPT